MTQAQSNSSKNQPKEYRDRLRRQGLRPIEIWVPDIASPVFEAEAHRQSLAVANSPHAKEDQDFIGTISDWEEG